MRSSIRCPCLYLLLLVPFLGAGCGRIVVNGLGRLDGGSDGPADMVRDVADGPTDRDPCVGSAVTDGGCGPTVWPNELSFTNSDKWLRDHHDQILAMKPRVLLLDFHNGTTGAAVMTVANTLISAMAESSRYHGYVDPAAPAFMQYQIVKTINLKDRSTGTEGASSLVPVDSNGAFDPNPLFTSQMFTDRYGFPDPAQTGRNLTLCELFEQGKINEVWMAVGVDPPRGPLIMDRKQMYDANNERLEGMFEPCAGGGGCLPDVTCKVTVRMAHVTPILGATCDVDIRGFPFESKAMFEALPSFAANAAAFTNSDFRKRFVVDFDSWYDVCDSAGTPCLSYPTPTSARGVDRAGAPFLINPFVQGCGSARFPPNALRRNGWESNVTVQSRCEHFGLKDGSNGQDTPDLYNLDKVRALTNTWGSDCGGGWQIYLRQNMPGLGNKAKGDDGQPMRNWWPYLFY